MSVLTDSLLDQILQGQQEILDNQARILDIHRLILSNQMKKCFPDTLIDDIKLLVVTNKNGG